MSLVKRFSIAIGLIPIGFGLNWFYSTASGLSFFNLLPPSENSQLAPTVQCMAAVIGVRNLFMGIAIVAAGLFNERKTLGVLLLAVAFVAGVDGIAANTATGEGAWSHWSYAPLVTFLGIANLRSRR